MAIQIIIGAAFGAAALAAVFFAVRAYQTDAKKGMLVVSLVVAVLMVVGILVVPLSFHLVDTGEIAVVKHLGEAKKVVHAGTHFDFWVTNTYQYYDAKVQNVDIDTAAYSSDAQTMNIQMTLQFQIMGDKVLEIANQYGSLETLENRIQSIAIEKTKAILSAYKAMDIISNRASMSPAVEQAVKEAVGDEYFVDITAVVLTNIDFSDAFELAVEEKMIAEQNQLKAEYENTAKIAQAEANAKAIIVAAEAEATANELLEKSLTDNILREMYIEKWDGKLPEVVAGEDAMSIMVSPGSSTSAE